MVYGNVQMVKMNPQPHVVHLPAPVIQTFVFQLERSFSLEKIVDTASMLGIRVGVAILDSV